MSAKMPILFAHSAGPQYGPRKGSYDLVHFLRVKLGDAYRVSFPTIPAPSAPSYSKYRELFANAFSRATEPLLLIGHSLGASTLLKYLSEETPQIPVRGLFLVSTPHWTSRMKEFQLKPHFEKQLTHIPKIFLYHSKRDQDVPITHLAFYESAFRNAVVRRLNGSEHTFQNGLPRLASDIRAL